MDRSRSDGSRSHYRLHRGHFRAGLYCYIVQLCLHGEQSLQNMEHYRQASTGYRSEIRPLPQVFKRSSASRLQQSVVWITPTLPHFSSRTGPRRTPHFTSHVPEQTTK